MSYDKSFVYQVESQDPNTNVKQWRWYGPEDKYNYQDIHQKLDIHSRDAGITICFFATSYTFHDEIKSELKTKGLRARLNYSYQEHTDFHPHLVYIDFQIKTNHDVSFLGNSITKKEIGIFLDAIDKICPFLDEMKKEIYTQLGIVSNEETPAANTLLTTST